MSKQRRFHCSLTILFAFDDESSTFKGGHPICVDIVDAYVCVYVFLQLLHNIYMRLFKYCHFLYLLFYVLIMYLVIFCVHVCVYACIYIRVHLSSAQNTCWLTTLWLLQSNILGLPQPIMENPFVTSQYKETTF